LIRGLPNAIRGNHRSGRLGSVNSIGGATFAISTVPTAQAVLHKLGQFDSIFLAAKNGVSQQALARQVLPLLP
jgi:hypothetical protein